MNPPPEVRFFALCLLFCKLYTGNTCIANGILLSFFCQQYAHVQHKTQNVTIPVISQVCRVSVQQLTLYVVVNILSVLSYRSGWRVASCIAGITLVLSVHLQAFKYFLQGICEGFIEAACLIGQGNRNR